MLTCTPDLVAASRYDKWFQEYTILHFGGRVSARWAKAVAMAESNLKPTAVSHVGARGIMQFMPKSWAWMAPEPWKSIGPFDPEAAIFVGCRYLRWNWNRIKVTNTYHRKAMVNSSYNAGLGWLIKARKKCRQVAGCCPDQWDNHVEENLVTRPSAQHENRTYVVRIRKFERRLLLTGEFL